MARRSRPTRSNWPVSTLPGQPVPSVCWRTLRWLPCCYNPGKDRRRWYTQLMFAQHAANLSPVWGRAQGTGHPGITMFNRGGGPITFDPLNRLDRQMNAHLFLFGPTGSGKSATLNNLLHEFVPQPFDIQRASLCKMQQRLFALRRTVESAGTAGDSLALQFHDRRVTLGAAHWHDKFTRINRTQ